jgi:hypothetical protein
MPEDKRLVYVLKSASPKARYYIGRRDRREKSVEKFIEFSRRLRVEFTAVSSRLTAQAQGANTPSAVA